MVGCGSVEGSATSTSSECGGRRSEVGSGGDFGGAAEAKGERVPRQMERIPKTDVGTPEPFGSVSGDSEGFSLPPPHASPRVARLSRLEGLCEAGAQEG